MRLALILSILGSESGQRGPRDRLSGDIGGSEGEVPDRWISDLT